MLCQPITCENYVHHTVSLVRGDLHCNDNYCLIKYDHLSIKICANGKMTARGMTHCYAVNFDESHVESLLAYVGMVKWCDEWEAMLSRGGSHIDMVYVYVPAFWGTFSRNLV